METEPRGDAPEYEPAAAEAAIAEIFRQGEVGYAAEIDGYEVAVTLRPRDLEKDVTAIDLARSLLSNPSLYLILNRAQAEAIWQAISTDVNKRRDALTAAAATRLPQSTVLFPEVASLDMPSDADISAYQTANSAQRAALLSTLASHPFFGSSDSSEIVSGIISLTGTEYAAWQMADLLAELKPTT